MIVLLVETFSDTILMILLSTIAPSLPRAMAALFLRPTPGSP